MRDFRNAPDETVITPERCGHRLYLVSALFDCDRGAAHEGLHGVVAKARAAREPMGTLDDVEVTGTVEWEDARPPATVGDMRRIIRQADEEERRSGAAL